MPSQALAPTAPAAEPQPRNLAFYRVRDEMVRAYAPSTDEERLLVTQIARAWQRLQRLYDAESEILDQQDAADLFINDLERYKTLSRSITEAERMWRHAVELFHRARRRNESRSLESPRRRTLTTINSPRPTPASVPADTLTSVPVADATPSVTSTSTPPPRPHSRR